MAPIICLLFGSLFSRVTEQLSQPSRIGAGHGSPQPLRQCRQTAQPASPEPRGAKPFESVDSQIVFSFVCQVKDMAVVVKTVLDPIFLVGVFFNTHFRTEFSFICMFTGGTIWILAHGHVVLKGIHHLRCARILLFAEEYGFPLFSLFFSPCWFLKGIYHHSDFFSGGLSKWKDMVFKGIHYSRERFVCGILREYHTITKQGPTGKGLVKSTKTPPNRFPRLEVCL